MFGLSIDGHRLMGNNADELLRVDRNHPIHHIVQAALKQRQQIGARVAFTAISSFEIAAELLSGCRTSA